MKIICNNINKTNIGDENIQGIKNIWVYLFILEKFATSVSEKGKDAYASISEIKYDDYTQLKLKLDGINAEIQKISNETNISSSDLQKFSDLQKKQADCLNQIKSIQGDVVSLWQVDMTSLSTTEMVYTKNAYQSISDMFDNNKAFRRLK